MAKHTLQPDTWIDKFSDPLFGYAMARINSREIAQDLVQETFLVALRTKENYRGEVSEKNWLFIILKSRILDYYKKKKEVLGANLVSEEDDSDEFFQSSGHWAKNARPNPETTENMVREKEFFSVLEACKSRLNEMQNLVFTMKYLDGADSEFICKELDITSSNYWVLVHRAKLHLRRCLELKWAN